MTIALIGDNTADDYSGTEDVYMRGSNPTFCYYEAGELLINLYNSAKASALIKFSGLSGISGPVTVSSAEIFLYQIEDTDGFSVDNNFYRLLRNWVETEATYNVYSTGNSWTSGGAEGSGTDISATLTGAMTSDADNNEYKSMSTAQLATDAEDFINGDESNYGWLMQGKTTGIPGGSYVYKGYEDSEGTDGHRPYLYIDYTAGGGGVTVPQTLMAREAY